MATIGQFERTLLQFDLAFTSLSREKRLRKMEACEIYRCETSIKHSDELPNIISWKNASVTTARHAKISSDQASFVRHIISNTLPRDSIALDIGLSIFLALVYRFSSRTLLSVSAKVLPPQQSINLYFLGKSLSFRCRVSPLINCTPWSVFGIVCTFYQRITLRELGSIQLQVSTARTRREKRKERRKRRKNRGQSERDALHGIKQRWFAVRCKRHGYCASTLGWSIDEVSSRGNAGLLAFNDSAVNFDQPCIARG